MRPHNPYVRHRLCQHCAMSPKGGKPGISTSWPVTVVLSFSSTMPHQPDTQDAALKLLYAPFASLSAHC